MKTLSERITLEVLEPKHNVYQLMTGVPVENLQDIVDALHINERLKVYTDNIKQQFENTSQAEGKIIPNDVVADIAKAVELEFPGDLIAQTAAFITIYDSAHNSMTEVIHLLRHKYTKNPLSELMEFMEKVSGEKNTERKSEVSGGIGESKESV